ncbi:unnamed protein product [Lymnaea stagnalis]|uniref:Uncharacterized protein n=1 Tax=Lymnaea stagnalis TaxID=6523 RepID=A0AAV2IBK2_LYMST
MKNTMPHPNRYLKQAHVSEYEKVLKIQMLQKTLVGKITEGICKEKLIMLRERQLAQLKLLLAKRPGVDGPLELDKARHLILKKSNQNKALLAELNLTRSDLENSNANNGRLLADLKAVKEEIAMYKRRSINKVEAPVDAKPTFQIHRPKMKKPGFAVTKNRLIKATLTPIYTTSHTL